MNDMRLVVVGAAGRMGRAIIRMLADTPGAILSGALEHEASDHIGADAIALSGCGRSPIPVSADPLPLVVDADGIIDFSTPATSVSLAALAAQARIVHVIGTTGFAPEDLTRIEAASRHATIVRSGNMSLGINLVAALARKAAKALGVDFDAEIVEMHHRLKVDAPSGTALLLGDAVARGRGVSLDDHSVRSRDGVTGARPPGAIGFATLRGGTVVGDHSVIFAGEGERIEITHRAEDRSIFARGAIRAALWARGRKPGLYSMDDVIGLPDQAGQERKAT